jgi:hypothetical protein
LSAIRKVRVNERFVAAIDAHNVDQLLAPVTANHRFLDSRGDVLTGRVEATRRRLVSKRHRLEWGGLAEQTPADVPL